jgi:hypothetical protein
MLKNYPGLSKREFLGEEFYAMCQKEYDEARHYLKNCGRPQSEEDKWWIQVYKWKSQYWSNFL